jgi:hypothetical protein
MIKAITKTNKGEVWAQSAGCMVSNIMLGDREVARLTITQRHTQGFAQITLGVAGKKRHETYIIKL